MRLPDEEKIPWRDEVRANLAGVRLVVACAPGFAVALLVLTVVQGVVPAVVVSQLGRFLALVQEAVREGAGSASGRAAVTAITLMAGAIVVGQVLGPVHYAALSGLQRRFQAYLSRRIMEGVTALPGIAYFEDPAFRDKLEVSQWVGWAPVNSVQFISGIVQQLAQVAALGAVAATYAWWAPVLIGVASLPEGVASFRLVARAGWLRWMRSQDVRRGNYFRQLGYTLEPAKELRVFGLRDWTLGRQARFWLLGIQEVWDERRRSLKIRFGYQAIIVAAVTIVYASMLSAVLAGRLLVGPFAAAAMAAVQMSSSLAAVFRMAGQLRQSNFYLPTALQLMRVARTEPRLDVGGTRPARELERSGVRFEGVSFTYPGTERRVLDGLDLWIPSGSSVALVGENGAGKTTLIKLLCRFYDPSEGRILLDGVDIRELDLVSLRDRLAVIFQDFVRYQLPARDNVGFGSVNHLGEDALLREAAAKIGALETIEGLKDGWETPLAREFDGVDLSGGEWQRVALARTMMAQLGRDADLLILDEPTASLDVRLEHELYSHFADLSRGRTTLLVSHRFSTVRMADRIVYLEDGRVVEDGSHVELMASGGRYAELYELQASHFRLTGTLE